LLPTSTTLAPQPTSAPTEPAPPPSQNPAPKEPNPAHELGRRGEDLVAQFVKAAGFTVLCRNWRCREGELDILATDGDMLVVCEVKTRTTDEFGTPADAMNAKKIRRIKEATNRWLREYRIPYVPVRYDLAEVRWPRTGDPQLQYRRDAF
ncbi:MAG TPA: YraN family protein, partial [Pseudonocardiaceae bacterium]